MGDIGYVFPSHGLQLVLLGYILEYQYITQRFSMLAFEGRGLHPENFILYGNNAFLVGGVFLYPVHIKVYVNAGKQILQPGPPYFTLNSQKPHSCRVGMDYFTVNVYRYY